MSRLVLPLIFVAALSGCASGYSLVSPGAVSVSEIQIDADSGWNRVPNRQLSWARGETQVWTRNGLSLDRIVMIPRIEDGESVYRFEGNDDYPVYRSGMNDADIVELIDRTIEVAQGANHTEVTTNEVRAQRFGNDDGILFDLHAVVHDGPDYHGMAGAFVSDGHLNIVYFLGASPYYYESLSASAEAMIVSARR